ncbi:MAG: hypothetical protein QOD90_20 [Mycobacterium sp.]|jgi:hypothetical protein|nr:hypothetical protein [Mycobacterium sp.]
MFEIDLPDTAVVTPLVDAELVDAIIASSKLDSAVQARHLAAVGELWDRRKRRAQEDEREYFYIDLREAVAAEVAAALGITGSRAAGLIRVAEALRDRLPKVSAIFAKGEIDLAMVHAIVNRTELIEDPESLTAVDAALAERAPGWTKYSRRSIAEYIDSWIGRFDQAGVREKRKPTDNRYLDVRGSGEGMAGIWGNLHVNDAIVFDGRIDELVATVCPNDPRTKAQLRADAVRALSERADRMVCTCGDANCTGEQPGPDRDIVIHVLAESSTVDGDDAAPGYVSGFGPIAADTLRAFAKRARRKAFTIPRDAVAEPGYRPSVALAEFVRFRDLHCRFPGCDVPAARCDIDHTIPWPAGPTHPSNTKCLCRKNHLLKTFYVGPGGWRDRQLPDGTVVWTAPTGQTYTTKPGGPLYFPALGQPTGVLVLPLAPAESDPQRDRMMPRRQRTRAEDVAQRHAAERRRNEARIAAEEHRRGLRETGDCDPPPF